MKRKILTRKQARQKIEYCRKHHKARTLTLYRGQLVERCNTCRVYWQ